MDLAEDKSEQRVIDCAHCIERIKSELLVDLAHEFRTPLTLILGPMRDLETGSCGELGVEARRQINLARRSAERLEGIVEQILDTARLESGRLELRVCHGDLAGLLDQLAKSFGALAERRGLRLRFAPLAEAIPLWFDPEQLEKVFSNLLSNALRYTPRGGRAEMTVEAPEDILSSSAGKVVVTVRDEGPGVAVEDRERIFDRFYRVPRSTTWGDGGSGLGLPLARRLAELHGGSLTLESVPGEGSAFRVELRLGRDHFDPSQIVGGAPWRPAPRIAAEVSRVRSTSLGIAKSDRVGSDHGLHSETFSVDRTTVLVVDDHSELRAYVRRHLEPRYRVAEAADGVAGLAAARDLLPDLVVSDVMMPEMDGFALCQAIKEDPELEWVPVVLLTARAAASDKLDGLHQGADDYLTKPFDARELEARVDNLIATRRRLRQRFTGGNGHLRPRLPLAPGVRPTPADRDWLARARDAIETGFGDDAFSVETLATELAVHRSRLYKRLRQLTGRAPAALIADFRLERSAALLRTEGVSVSEVAYAAGFRSVSHFSRRFKERFKQSPSTWRTGRVAVVR